MPVSNVLDALAGFSGAYGKLASQQGTEIRHELRLSAIEASSFGLIVCAWVAMNAAAGQIQAFETLDQAARWVLGKITGVIAAKKHVQGEPYTFNVSGNGNTVVVINAQGNPLSLSPEVFDVFKDRVIDSELSKIVAPLKSAGVDSVQIRAQGGGEVIEEIITAEQRDSFRAPEAITTSRESEIMGTLVSLNKESNKGTFKLSNGNNIPYRYVGEDPHSFHADFALRGSVKVHGIAWFDENLQPVSLEIHSVERLQRNLFLPESNH